MGHEEISRAREHAVLSLFRGDVTAFRGGLEKPGVVCVYARSLCIPGDPERRFKFEDRGLDMNTECAPPELSARFQIRRRAPRELNVRGVLVPRWPKLRAPEPRPHTFTRCRNVDLVPHMDRNSIWMESFRPAYRHRIGRKLTPGNDFRRVDSGPLFDPPPGSNSAVLPTV